jgi:hypothetical protein
MTTKILEKKMLQNNQEVLVIKDNTEVNKIIEDGNLDSLTYEDITTINNNDIYSDIKLKISNIENNEVFNDILLKK